MKHGCKAAITRVECGTVSLTVLTNHAAVTEFFVWYCGMIAIYGLNETAGFVFYRIIFQMPPDIASSLHNCHAPGFLPDTR